MKEELCKNCGSTLVVKQTKKTAAQVKKPYYYSAYYLCPNCHKLYHSDKFKVVNTALFTDTQKSNIQLHEDNKLNDDNNHDFDVQIWTDGACVRNGTPRAKAAWAFVSGEKEAAGLVEGKQTNNVAEGLAILYALQWAAEDGYKKIQLHTDSQISLFNLAKPARMVKVNREIFEEIEMIIAKGKLEVSYKKVLGHSGDPNNERADALANTLAAKA